MTTFRLQEIDLHLTNRCQLRCRHCCFDAATKKTAELPLATWIRILHEARDLGVVDVDITGGEPLLFDDLDLVVREACALGFKPSVQTNAVFLDEQELLRLEAAGLKRLMISLDGSQSTHDWLRGDGMFELVSRNALRALRRGFQVRLNAVAMKSTLRGLPALIRWAGDSGFRLVSIFAFTAQGRGAHLVNEEMGYSEWSKSIEILTNVAAQYPSLRVIIEPAMGPLQAGLSSLSCPIVQRGYLQILSDGRAYPCTLLIFSKYYLADITHEPLSNCLLGDRWTYLLDKLSAYETGCPGYEVWRTGEIAPDPRVDRLELGYPICPLVKLDLGTRSSAMRSGGLITGEDRASPEGNCK